MRIILSHIEQDKKTKKNNNNNKKKQQQKHSSSTEYTNNVSALNFSQMITQKLYFASLQYIISLYPDVPCLFLLVPNSISRPPPNFNVIFLQRVEQWQCQHVNTFRKLILYSNVLQWHVIASVIDYLDSLAVFR